MDQTLKARFAEQIQKAEALIQRKQTVDSEESISHLQGIMSRVLFNTYFNKTITAEVKGNIESDIQRVFNFIENNQVSPFYVDGLTGVGWAISNISNRLGFDENGMLSGLDANLFEQARVDFSVGNYDFFYGGMGYLNYYAQRYKSQPDVVEYLLELIESLKGIRKVNTTGYFFQSEEDTKEEIVDLSLSHGLASIAMTLCKLSEIGIASEFIHETLEGLGKTIAGYQIENESGYRIPDFVQNEKAHHFAPLRWCHGDLGISIALMRIGNTINNEEFSTKGRQVIDTLSLLKKSNQELPTATVCHGTMGVAHLFSRAAQYCGNPENLRQAAEYWFAESEEILQSEIGFSYSTNGKDYALNSGVLNGVEGIGLVMNDYLNDTFSGWDSAILLS